MNESEEGKDNEDTKCKQKSRGKKRKRPASESSTDGEDVLPENTLEMEKNLHASAIKNNLDDVSVKKILKKVVTNDHVLALVKLREEEEENLSTEEGLRPKLTRAKAKELMKVSPKSAPWSLELMPIKHIPVKTRPEVTALIAQELPEDEDDEEYRPTPDDVPSDDDHTLESSSDVDSLPRTPATPKNQGKCTNVVTDGPFKVPQQDLTPARRKLVLDEEATIALRTRSKLSLSSTSIEHIESSFVPPDDLPMADVDSLWNDFLNDCLNPAPNARNEDDDETDPEYNVAADPDANEEDEESLENSIIKISKKELNDLVTELFSIIPEGPEDPLAGEMVSETAPETQTCWEGKQEPMSDDDTPPEAMAAKISEKRDSNIRFSIGKSEPADVSENVEDGQLNDCESSHRTVKNPEQVKPDCVTSAGPAKAPRRSPRPRDPKEPPASLSNVFKIAPPPLRVEIQKDMPAMTEEQLLLLQQQLRQHVQLAAGNFLQLYVHPTHWARAPSYKNFLMALDDMVKKNPSSSVNVCNLEPAVELVISWEATVSDSTQENVEMVEFIQKEVDRSRRRCAQNALYVGDFPELFMKVVANSRVFLYPYLLPPMPFRPDAASRRYSYLPPEDRLITLGMDQFWEYVRSNPQLYKPPAVEHRHQRWGLSATLQLVCRHMMPWMPAKALAAHVHHCRQQGSMDNPIFKFFATRELPPVRHKLVPFDPRRTLYEQPEHEVPRIWVRYLAKTSQRFRKYLYRRRPVDEPKGIELEMSVEAGAPKKGPLPNDFTKQIPCHRLNIQPEPEPNPPINVVVDDRQNPALVAKNVFTIVSTSNGSFIIPLQFETKTVDSTDTPLCTAAKHSDDVTQTSDVIEGTRTAEISNPTNDLDHCSCCILLRQICRRQKTIVDYFKKSQGEGKCECKGRRYPKITNRLRLLSNNFKVRSQVMFRQLKNKIEEGSKEVGRGEDAGVICDDDEEHDLALATAFQQKLAFRAVTARKYTIKRSLQSAFSTFDPDTHDPVEFAAKLYKTFDVDLVDMYKEFIGFLTAEQADKLGLFRDFFIQRCIEKLVPKIEELVPEKEKRSELFAYLKSKFQSNVFVKWSACDICTALLRASAVRAHPSLARYLFALFPHQRDVAPLKTAVMPEEKTSVATKSQATAEYEADNSSSGDDEDDLPLRPARAEEAFVNEQDDAMKFEEEEIDVVNTSVAKVESGDSAMAPPVLLDEDSVKSESPEWTRDEDKVLLEVLKEHLTPEARRDKTVVDVLEETRVLALVTDSLPHKSAADVRDRVLYLLQLLASVGC